MENKFIIQACKEYLLNHGINSFKIVYHYYYKSLCFFAQEYLKQSLLAEDIVQDVFSQVWEKPPRLTEHTKLQAYLYMMVRNRCLNIIKNQKQYQKFQDSKNHLETWEQDESISLIKAEVSREIFNRIEKLPQRAREVFKLSYLSQLKEYEVAERLQISINSVKTHKKRSRKILKDQLKSLLSDS